MDDLIAWVRDVHDQIEQLARAAAEELGWATSPGTGRWKADAGEVLDAGVTGDAPNVISNEGIPTWEQAEHIALWDPATVLRKIQSERKILDRIAVYSSYFTAEPWAAGDDALLAEEILRQLAEGYSGWPGYLDSWRS
jgi:hypothetical protein